MIYMIFQYVLELYLIQWISIGIHTRKSIEFNQIEDAIELRFLEKLYMDPTVSHRV